MLSGVGSKNGFRLADQAGQTLPRPGFSQASAPEKTPQPLSSRCWRVSESSPCNQSRHLGDSPSRATVTTSSTFMHRCGRSFRLPKPPWYSSTAFIVAHLLRPASLSHMPPAQSSMDCNNLSSSQSQSTRRQGSSSDVNVDRTCLMNCRQELVDD